VKIVKNKVAPPFQICQFDIMYDEGISRSGDLLELGMKYGLIKKVGLTFSYQKNKLGAGRENARLALKKNLVLMNEIEKDIKQVVKEKQEKA
ncbi:MAG: DNA recombination/repair protein RecA, partial [Candidatus Aenigmarchaeota archaeon]|nr:DNA recombination/repair protein RecA [Candidatus Aenigmarchaeota archaeon]